MDNNANCDATEVPAILINLFGPSTSKKFFFQRLQDDVFASTEKQQRAARIKNGGNFEVPVTPSGFIPGWYCAVFCVALDHLEGKEDSIDRIIFDVTSKELSTGILCSQDYTCKTIIGRDEIAGLLQLPRTKPTRLKLHRQIEVRSDADLAISMKVETVADCEEEVSFDLHYFELTYPNALSEDYVLYGEGKPDQFIQIGAESADFEEKPIAIEAWDVSVSGKLVVTVYFSPANSDTRRPDGNRKRFRDFAARPIARVADSDSTPESDRASDRTYSIYRGSIRTLDRGSNRSFDHGSHRSFDHGSNRSFDDGSAPFRIPTNASIFGVAHIQVWDLDIPTGQASFDDPQAITAPVSSWSVHVSALRKSLDDSQKRNAREDFPRYPKPMVNISSTGLHIIMAVGSAKKAVHAAPFFIYRAEQNPPVQYGYNQVSRTCQEIQRSFGFGAFHNTKQDDPYSEHERYFNIYGSQLDIYSTNGTWKQLHSLNFGIKRTLRILQDMFYLADSLRGRYFAWAGDSGSVSIWDFETGKFVTSILIPKDKRAVCAALSEDGSMVAITVNGRIQVHDVASGIKLGVHETRWKEHNRSEIIFRQDYFMALDAARSTSGNKNIDARSILRVRDMKVVKIHHLFWQYAASLSSTLNPIFSYRQGAILNIKRLGNILSPAEDDDCTPSTACAFEDTPLNLSDDTWTQTIPSSAGITFALECDNSLSRSLSIQKLIITNGPNNASLSLGPAQESRHCSGLYLASSSQLVLILNGFLQVWRLPSTAGQHYELIHVEAFVVVSKFHANDTCITRASTVQSCTHGRKVVIKMEPVRWHYDSEKQKTEDDQENDEGDDGQGRVDFRSSSIGEGTTDNPSEEQQHPENDQAWRTLTFPRAAEESFPATEKHRDEIGIISLLPTYEDSDLQFKTAITCFLIDRIRPSPESTSSLVILCRYWKEGDREIFEEVIAKLLPDGYCHTWIPDINATREEDPLSILMKTAKRYPSVLGACKIIMNYCVNHAIGSKNLTFLAPFLRNLKKIMVSFPDEARVYLRRISYIPVTERWRDYIVRNSIVVNAPRRSFQLRKNPMSLNEITKPVMQLHVTTQGSRIQAGRFNRPIYAASFDALWYFEDMGQPKGINPKEPAIKRSPVVEPWWRFKRGSTIKQQSMPEAMAIQEATTVQIQEAAAAASLNDSSHLGIVSQRTTWWKMLYYMLLLKFHVRAHNYVTCHAFSLEFFDNPAIAALVDYKWNTIGYTYWAVRFSSQCVYYLLVVSAALLQIYHENVGRTQMAGVFIAIITVGAAFLWLELLQAIKDFKRYKRCPNNAMDIVAYTLPMAASIVLLMALRKNDSMANTSLLSFSVLIVLLHMLFELRIFKSVCQYETFIRQSVIEIRVFFLIFAGGLVAFTIAILHLLRGCPVPDSCEDSKTEFSSHFFGALSATYFFVGGRFDPVAEELKKEYWTFHIMMMIYFFFTVIVMLNVLIALINVAFKKRDDGLRFIRARLHYVELVENLSYHIPGFRQTHNCFPREIYFCATAEEDQEIAKASEDQETARASEAERKILEAEREILETERKQFEAERKELEAENKASLKSDPAIVGLMEQVEKLNRQLMSQQKQRADY